MYYHTPQYFLGGLRLGMTPQEVADAKGPPDGIDDVLGWLAWTYYRGTQLTVGFQDSQTFFIQGQHVLRLDQQVIAGPNVRSQSIFDHFGEPDQPTMSRTARDQDMVHCTFRREGYVFFFSGQFLLGGLWTIGMVRESLWDKIPHVG